MKVLVTRVPKKAEGFPRTVNLIKEFLDLSVNKVQLSY